MAQGVLHQLIIASLLLVSLQAAWALDAVTFNASCELTLRQCQSPQCVPMPLTPVQQAATTLLGRGFDVQEYPGGGDLPIHHKEAVFSYTYCTSASPSAHKVRPANVLVPCEADYIRYDPPVVDWQKLSTLFSSSEMWSRENYLKLGLAGVYNGISASGDLQYSKSTVGLALQNYFYALNDRRVLVGEMEANDWRCYPFHYSFRNHLYSLHATDPSDSSYTKMFNVFGTHVITSVSFGGRVVLTARVGRCDAAEQTAQGVAVQIAAHDLLESAISKKANASTSFFTGHTVAKSASAANVHVETAGGDQQILDGTDKRVLAGNSDIWFKYVDSVGASPDVISVVAGQSITPLYELASANINLFTGNRYDAARWKQVRQTFKLATQMYIDKTDAGKVEATVKSCKTILSGSSESSSKTEWFIAVGVLGLLLVIIFIVCLMVYCSQKK